MISAAVAERAVPIPEGVQVEVNGRFVSVKGPKGALAKNLGHMPVDILVKSGNVVVYSNWPRKKETSLVGTAAASIKNMIRGVTKGFVYKLKVVYAHFPVTVKVLEREKKILIENFTGEKTARFARIVGDVKVTASGDEIVVQGIDLEAVSQTAANIEEATKIKDKDQRVFLDGIYIYEKAEGS